MMVTGKAAYSRMEEINRMQAIAEDDTQPESVRQAVTDELMRITAGGPVRPATQRVVAQQALAELDALAADTTQPAGIRDAAASGAARVRELADTAGIGPRTTCASGTGTREKRDQETPRTARVSATPRGGGARA